MVDTANTTGTLRLDLGERVADTTTSVLSGTWMMTFADAQRNARGSLSGLVNGTQMAGPRRDRTARILPAGAVRLTRHAVDHRHCHHGRNRRHAINYAVCANAQSGTITLRRQ